LMQLAPAAVLFAAGQSARVGRGEEAKR
jgi:hypothetical protein